MKDAYFRANAAALILDDNDNILILRRKEKKSDSIKHDVWQFPQGGIGFRESPEEALIREVWEETGIPKNLLKVQAEVVDWMVYQTPTRWAQKKDRWGQAQKWFLCRVPTGTIPVPDNDEFNDYKWIPANKLFDYVVSFRKTTYAKVIRILHPQLDIGI
jgi:putative (di)nucleoside polyphosphate hydrolase